MTKYEFTKEENIAILKFSKYMMITSILTIIFGALAIIFSIISVDIVSTLYFAFFIIAGISFYLPVDNFERIAKTEGSDIEELIQGFKELSKFWNVVVILAVVLLVFEIVLAF
jgi:hypothetical protein